VPVIERSPEYHVRMIIVPDKKTPPGIFQLVEDLKKDGMAILCPTVEEQDRLLHKLGAGAGGFIPYNSDNRRNIGFLRSWADHPDVMISVDDDNYPHNGNYFSDHAIVAQAPSMHFGIISSTGWYNNCRMLRTRPETVYPRGFPYYARTHATYSETWEIADVAINAGLWLGDPDVDAITRIGAAPIAQHLEGISTVLAPDTWMPVNSQNTALRHDVIPSYYFVRMGHEIAGMKTGRLGDIFSGYFAEACAKHMGHTVKVGPPLADQVRNYHDLLHDLELEFPALRLLDQLLTWLVQVRLEGSTYRDTYECLSYMLHDAAEDFGADSEKGFLHRMAYHMRTWLKLCDQIGKE
jgi:hypothetical protein